MSVPVAPWTERIFRLLRERGEPVALEAVIASVRNLVPPGRAFRAAETNRKRIADSRGVEMGEVDASNTIRSGQRSIVMDSITKMVSRGRLVYSEEAGVRYLGLGRDALPSVSQDTPRIKKLNEHQPTYTRRNLPGIFDWRGHQVFTTDIGCSCGWHLRSDDTGTKADAMKLFTQHRHSFV